jgi:hypothetical protein
MAHMVFKCSATGLNVHHWLDGDLQLADDEYEAITCVACARVHFLNRKSGKLFARESEQGRPRSRPFFGLNKAQLRPVARAWRYNAARQRFLQTLDAKSSRAAYHAQSESRHRFSQSPVAAFFRSASR